MGEHPFKSRPMLQMPLFENNKQSKQNKTMASCGRCLSTRGRMSVSSKGEAEGAWNCDWEPRSKLNLLAGSCVNLRSTLVIYGLNDSTRTSHHFVIVACFCIYMIQVHENALCNETWMLLHVDVLSNWCSFSFRAMSRQNDTCCICHQRIMTKREGRPITSISNNIIYCNYQQKMTAKQLVCISHALNDHICIWKQKVIPIRAP